MSAEKKIRKPRFTAEEYSDIAAACWQAKIEAENEAGASGCSATTGHALRGLAARLAVLHARCNAAAETSE